MGIIGQFSLIVRVAVKATSCRRPMDNHCGSVVFVISSRATASFRDGEQVLNRPFTVTPAWVAVACVIGAALWVGGPSTWREIVWERLLGGASAESLRSDDAREQDRKDEHSSRASNSDRRPRYVNWDRVQQLEPMRFLPRRRRKRCALRTREPHDGRQFFNGATQEFTRLIDFDCS